MMEEKAKLFTLTTVMEKEVSYPIKEKMGNPYDIHYVLEKAFNLDTAVEEHMVMMTLDTKNKITGVFHVSQGTLNASLVHPREIYKRAIVQNANAIIIAHNHPSGDTTPSGEDIKLTTRLAETGKIIGITLLDHLIMGGGDFLSFAEEGLLS